MEISDFESSLYVELIKRGIPEETAKAGIAGITKDITAEKREMIERISNSDELSHFANALASRITAQERAKKPQPVNAAAPTAEFSSAKNIPKVSRNTATVQMPRTNNIRHQTNNQPRLTFPEKIKQFINDIKKRVAANTDSAGNRKMDPARNPAGAKTFTTVMICSSPLWILGLLIVAAVLALCLASVVLLITACIALLIAVTVSGVGISLVGIIYGIIKLFSVVPEGIYEIGLAAVIAGFTMLIGILLYNLAVRYIPMLFRPVGQLAGYAASKISDLYFYVKKECYNR